MSDAQPLVLGALVGSLRTGSVHRALFERAATAAPDDVDLREIPIVDLPFFNQDLEGPDGPASVRSFQDAVGEIDGLVIFTPEYNAGVPALTKNAIDWASRPRGAAPIQDLPVLIVAATPGRHEVENVRRALTHTAASAGARVHERSLGLASITRRLEDQTGELELITELRASLTDFVDFIGGGLPPSGD